MKLVCVAAFLFVSLVQGLPQLLQPPWSPMVTNGTCDSSTYKCIYCHDPGNACCGCWIDCDDECSNPPTGSPQACCDCWLKQDKFPNGTAGRCDPSSQTVTDNTTQAAEVATPPLKLVG